MDNSENKDDGCIGNRLVRTICLSALLGIFMIFAAPFWFDVQSNSDAAKEACDKVFQEGCGSVDDLYYSSTVTVSGNIITIAGALIVSIGFVVNVLRSIGGFVTLSGGLLYCIGGIWFMIKLYGGSDNQQLNNILYANIGEVILPGITAIILGLDAGFLFLDNEANRLSLNLALLMVVSCLCMGAYYAAICTDDETVCIQPDGVEAIATGYLIIFWTSLVYIILYICQCCTCNLKDTLCVRLIIAIALIAGGVVSSIGYYVYAGGWGSLGLTDDETFNRAVAYYIGYTILFGGLCVVWALDMALDDWKKR